MTILAVDDEIGALTALGQKIEVNVKDALIKAFTNPEEALNYAEHNLCDIAFLDIDMPKVSGIEVARLLKQINPQLNIIFVTAYSQYGVDAFALYASGYLLKPVSRSDIKMALENLRYPVLIEKDCEDNLEQSEVLANTEEPRKWFTRFMIDTKKMTVYRVEDKIVKEFVPLSPTEYNILIAMTEHQDEVISYSQLYKSVWGQEDIGDVRTLMVHVSNLRKKIDLNHTEMIRSIRGYGYIFQDI